MSAVLPEHYARLRTAALQGDRSVEGLSVITFHGLWHGLSVLARQTDLAPTPCAPTSPAPAQQASDPHAGTHDRQLVRQLANMVLATQSRKCHVY